MEIITKQLSTDTLHLDLLGELKQQYALQLKQQLIHLLHKEKKNIVLDISKIQTMDIIGLNTLVIIHKTANRIGKKLTIAASSNSKALKVIHLTKFDQILNFSRA